MRILCTIALGVLFGFNILAQETIVPDDNFEAYLETHDANGSVVSLGDPMSMGNGIANDDKVYTSSIENVIELDISDLGITDASGIEGFTGLKILKCNDNSLSSLDVSENIALERLDCYKNSLTSLNISNNIALTMIQCFRNELTNLDVSTNVALTRIDVFSNQLTSLDISNNIELTSLNCARNQLSNLDLSKNPKMERLSCYDNDLATLDTTTLPLLTDLDCVENNLTSLDLSMNPALEYLQVYENSLTSLDLSKNVKLIELYAEYNEITSLDLSKNVAIVDVSCYNNQLTYLNLRNGNNSNFDTRDFDIRNNPNLTCVSVDNPVDALATFTDKDDHTIYTTFCNTTFVPDDNFENYLETHTATGAIVAIGDPASMGNGVPNDDYVGTEAIQNITYLNVSNQSISDFTGIEAFISLEELRCFDNPVTNLNLSANVELRIIEANSLNLHTIDISGLTKLTTLSLNSSNLTSIDVASNIALERLSISYNSITEIDLANNTSLRDLRIVNNELQSLDISANTELTHLYCNNNNLTELNVINNKLLENLVCGQNQISSLDVSQLSHITDLFIDDTPTLTVLDVSHNMTLEDIGVSNTSLTSLDLSANTKLIEVYTDNTAITTLDFSNSPDIEYIECRNNELTSLILRNGNNSRSIELYATGNSNLTCIEIDDPSASYLSSWQVDSTTSFSEFCRLTYIPNDNFEALLEARGLGNGIANDDYVYTGLISEETTLMIQDQEITDVTGIEDFESLEVLLIRRSNLENIDLTQNTKLTHLNLTDNNLTTIDMSYNVLLEEVYLDGNSLNTIDISQLELLTAIGASNTGINTIDIANNPVLRVLNINDNQFTSLDISQNPSIVQLRIQNNTLTSLDVANGNNTNFTWFEATGNPELSCIQVDDINLDFSLWIKDHTANYSENCKLKLSTLVFLQGALINPNTGEDELMRDDLRISGMIPLTSPYADNVICDASLLITTGETAVVDWIEIQLRDKNNAVNIVESRSALVLRNGTVVAPNGSSEIEFTSNTDSYFVSIHHRNHLAIITASTLDFDTSSVQTLNLAENLSAIQGGVNAMVEINSGIYAMMSGDYNQNGQIQNSDVNAVIQLLGKNEYNSADMDMNGQIQNADINNIINVNLGKGQQF